MVLVVVTFPDVAETKFNEGYVMMEDRVVINCLNTLEVVGCEKRRKKGKGEEYYRLDLKFGFAANQYSNISALRSKHSSQQQQ